MGQNILFVMSAAAGLVMIVGGLALLWKGRVYINEETKEVTSIELPLGIRIKTNLPVVALFVIAAGLILVPLYQYKPPEEFRRIRLTGLIKPRAIGLVKVLAVPATQETRDEVSLQVPRSNEQYDIYFIRPEDFSFLASKRVLLGGREGDTVELEVPTLPEIQGQADWSGFKAVREAESVVAQFK